MVNVIELAIRELLKFGFYDLILFMFSSAVIYALLRKIKFSPSKTIDGIIAISFGFSIMLYRVLYGLSLITPLTGFFAQVFVFGLIFMFGVILAGFFYPDLNKILLESMKSRRTLFALVALVLAISLASNLAAVFWTAPVGATGIGPDPMTVTIIVASIIMIIVLMLISTAQKR